MPSRYEPKDHIQRLEIAPRAEGILDQREVTIQSYQTTVPFNYEALDKGLAKAWLTPQIRFGVFSRIRLHSDDALSVVLGLQDELTIRAYDYDERRPLWYSWQDAIVDTVNIHYFRDENGLLRFTTTGGGRRITDDRLHEFNSAFLAIPSNAVGKRQFDLEKLRELCFSRFAKRLYMIRFADPSGKEYRSIDHALFQSRGYIDPNVERLREIKADKLVKIESFDSDIGVLTDELASQINVRFFIRGLSGSLRLRFPKVSYKAQLKTPEEQTLAFHRLADAAVSAILDADYYAHQPRSLDDLSVEYDLFPEMVDLAPFREVLTSAAARRDFLLGIDLNERWQKWSPHLQAIDELLSAEVVETDVKEILIDLANSDPRLLTRLLAACQDDAGKHRLGSLVARALAAKLQTIEPDLRAIAEESLLGWAIECEQESWDVDEVTGEFSALGMKWRVEDVAFDALPSIIWKLLGVLHDRLKAATCDISPLLSKFNWCVTAAKSLPAHHSKNVAALRLVAAGRVPRSVAEARKILKEPVAELRALDDAVLAQFGLPLWPSLAASRRDGKLEVSNDGMGAALAVRLSSPDKASNKEKASAFDLAPGASISLPFADGHSSAEVCFEKLGKEYKVALPVNEESGAAPDDGHVRKLPLIICRKRLSAQRKCRQEIDPTDVVVGSSPGLLSVFEQIHHANLIEGLSPVLLLGEPGVGKTHIAQLLHNSSPRSAKPFKVVNAGGGGGDLNIQRGEWIGYGKNHGIQNIDVNGRPGHLMNAHGGTLFVDEFATLSLDLQVIFLSVLERRSVEKIGGESFIPDVRCVFATNADVEELVSNGTLRRDLVDRIAVKFCIPPLRERRGDILLLAKHFSGIGISDRCLLAVLRHNWPGNIRELQNKMAAAKARTKSEKAATIHAAHVDLPAEIVSEVDALDDEACRRELWTVADEIARAEGFEHGSGLQRRAGEIMGVGEPQASKAYQAYGLAPAASA